MKKLYYSLFPFVMCLALSFGSSDTAFAKSLKQTADKLGKMLTGISLSVAIGAIALSAFYFYQGKNDALERFGKVLGGIFITVSAVTIVNFFKSVA